MSRFQLSLNVSDVDASVEFYSKLLGVKPAKHRDGYANFIVEDPPLKLIVIEAEGESGSINHVGIEYESGDEVASQTQRIAELELPVKVDDPHTCCFATQEKAWTIDADGIPWELYTVVDDTEHFGANPHGGTPLDVLLPPVSVEELEAALEDPNVVVIDAQGDDSYGTAHIAGTNHFDFNGVAEQAATTIASKDQRVLVYCTDKDCLGAEFVGTLLVEAGYSNVGRFPGGVEDWAASGRTVETGSGVSASS